ELELRWGPAPIALFRLLEFILGNLRDRQIIWCNVILSSSVPVLLYLMLTELDLSSNAALLAAFVVSAHPLLIAFSGVLERQPAYLFAACGSTLALLRFLKRGAAQQFVAFIVGTILATTSRPEGAHLVILHSAVLTCVGSRWRNRLVATATLVCLSTLAVAYIHTLSSTTPHPSPFFSGAPLWWSVLLSRDYTPFAWIAASVLGLLIGLRQRAGWIAGIALLGFDMGWSWTGLDRMFVGHLRHVASTRYQTILLVPFSIAVGLFIQTVLSARTWLKVGCIVALLGWTAASYSQPYDVLIKPFTIDYEYRFLAKHAATLPSGSSLYIFDTPIDDIGFLDAHLVGLFTDSVVRFVPWSGRACGKFFQDSSTPSYLYIGSACANLLEAPDHPLASPDYIHWLQDCAAIRARVADHVVDEIDVPARRVSWFDFADQTVHLGLYRLSDPTVCELGPPQRQP
ncbi:MAG TPA: glycosyltransferase family 39 protein, partial [Candidatus Acidoferrales bacterium]|nr:glycosyltransferase family 39 protein [Candidatus Acidoferrales bacterium]